MKLKICLIVRALPVHRLGGLEHHARDLAFALVNRGHVVHIVSTPGATKEIFEAATGVVVHEIPDVRPADYSVLFFRKLNASIKALCAREKFDVILPVDLTGLFLKKPSSECKVVPLIHGTMTSEVPLDWRYFSRLGTIQKLKSLWRYKVRLPLIPMFRRMILCADAIIVDSEFTRRELLLEMPALVQNPTRKISNSQKVNPAGLIHVAQLGIDESRYPRLDSAPLQFSQGDVLKIALLGRLQRIKGLEIALTAAKELKARGCKFFMSIAGSGTFSTEASDLIAKWNLGESVQLVGKVLPAELGAFFQRHHLFLFPDLTQPAFGLVAVEAMQYSLPVVAARVGAVPEVVTSECGWLYNPWEASELAGLLAKISATPGEVAEKARAAKVRSKEFTAELMGERTEAAIYCALGKRQD